jgi:hypothetical protein
MDGGGRDEEERETVCLFLEAVTGRLIRSGLFTPRREPVRQYYLILYILFFYNTHAALDPRLSPPIPFYHSWAIHTESLLVLPPDVV